MARRDVLAGQRYQKADSNFVFEVKGLTKDAEGVVHARLERVGDHTAIKMISVAALKDTRLYRLLEG
jgi:hypothetical protein